MNVCARLKKDKNGKYVCTLTKRACPYQRYCNVQHKYVSQNNKACPGFKAIK